MSASASASDVEAIEEAIKAGSIRRLRSLDQLYPGALERVPLPFHIATEHGAPYKVVKFLIERVPNKVSARTWQDYTALHVATKGTGVSVVRLLLLHGRGLLRARNQYGWTFLHTAVRNGLPLEVIERIVRRWPESVRKTTRDDTGRVPLHFVGEKTSAGVVQFLFGAWAESFDAETRCGCLPLHLAAMNGAPLPVIQLLVRHRPRSTRERGRDGRLPLHVAAFGSTPDVVEYLLKEWPESIRESDDYKNFPLHWLLDLSD